MLNEINDLAGQHEVISENLYAVVIKELHALIKDVRDERKVNISIKRLNIEET